jgi:hypothetical protein
MGEALESMWLLIASFLSGNAGFAVFLSLPIVFGALGYSFRLTALFSTVFYFLINIDGPKAHDLDENRAWLIGSLLMYLFVFWILHKAAQFIFRPTIPIHTWIIDSWLSRK